MSDLNDFEEKNKELVQEKYIELLKDAIKDYEKLVSEIYSKSHVELAKENQQLRELVKEAIVIFDNDYYAKEDEWLEKAKEILG